MNITNIREICSTYLLKELSRRYGLQSYAIELIPPHAGGRNVVYNCTSTEHSAKILRISFLGDRSREDYLGEAEYVRYLCGNGCKVSGIIASRDGNCVEEIVHENRTFYACLFERATGMLLVDNGYCYREGAPLSEYFYNCGKTLGRMHHLSKSYEPIHPRRDFFDRFNAEHIDDLFPGSLQKMKKKMKELLIHLLAFSKDRSVYGMTHFDFNDGNYFIDYETGDITVFDFDNACFCWYLFDLAGLWTHGVGWVQFERDREKRRHFMGEYFAAVIEGYRSETYIADCELAKLSLFIQVSLIEDIVDAFEVMRNGGGTPECDEELSYRIKCLEEGIPFMGFFDEVYNCDEPFQWQMRRL